MGAQIALSLALGGCSVQLYGRRSEGLEEAKERIADGLEFLVDSQLAEDGQVEEVMGRLSFTTTLDAAVSDAGFVIEAVAEDLEIKQDLLGRTEALVDPDTILSSTTSAISATDIQSKLKRPGSFCIAHYAQPAHLVALVEVVPGQQTLDGTAAAVEELLKATGKAPVRCPDIPGFLWARIQHAVLREFATLVGKGVVTAEACDTILRQGYAARLPAMGAFEHADLAGLDLLNSSAAKAVWADLSNVTDPAQTPVGALFQQGKFGMKTGEGFYNWRQRDPEEFKRARDQEIVRRAKIQKGASVSF